MGKGKRIGAVTGDIPLPEAAIQHILSFLDTKQAAQTSILSKSWYNAWLTRPNIDLDERYFVRSGYSSSQIANGFSEFAKKTMQRYEELNLRIENFRLRLDGVSYKGSLANELIVKALKMSANDLNFELRVPDPTFILPHEVLGVETLIRLSLSGCTIDRPVNGKVSCSRLESLSLYKMCIGNDIIKDIVMSCPLIQKLLLSECKCFVGVKEHLRKVRKIWAWKPLITSDFHKLKFLLLERVVIDFSFFRDFSLKFPCMEDLTLSYCKGYGSIRILSHSLKYISLEQTMMLKAHFDVPSIRKFSCSGSSSIPSVLFGRALGGWESNISIKCCQYRVSGKWFLRLKKFLGMLSPSKISLSINFFLVRRVDYVGEIEGLSKPVVENLMVSMNQTSLECSALLDGLLWSFRPKVITHNWYPKAKNEFLELLCKRLIQQVSQSPCIPNPNMFGLHDLKEVSVELFKDSLAEWQPLPLKSFLDPSPLPAKTQKVRFQLTW